MLLLVEGMHVVADLSVYNIHVLTGLVQLKWYRGPENNTIEGHCTLYI